ncbi:hypothetical protein GGR40_001498 [Novosphingobium gossypii]
MEIGIADWERDKDSEERQDQIKLGDVQLRYGLAARSELQLSWPAYVHTVTRDYRAGAVERSHGVGDVTIGLKQNLRHPQEKAKGLALSILPYLSLPTGTHGGGDGDWSAGAVVPLSYKFSDLITLAVSPRIEAAVDEDRSGRHLAFGTAAGLQLAICDGVRLSPEVEIMRDRDPVQPATTASAAMSVAWKVANMTQLDVQGIAGLNAATPGVRLALGVSHKF